MDDIQLLLYEVIVGVCDPGISTAFPVIDGAISWPKNAVQQLADRVESGERSSS